MMMKKEDDLHVGHLDYYGFSGLRHQHHRGGLDVLQWLATPHRAGARVNHRWLSHHVAIRLWAKSSGRRVVGDVITVAVTAYIVEKDTVSIRVPRSHSIANERSNGDDDDDHDYGC